MLIHARKHRLLVALAAGLALAALSATAHAAGWSKVINPGSMTVSTNTLAAPTSLSAAGSTLSWTAATSTWAGGVQILRSPTTGGPYTQAGQTTGVATTTYTDTPGAGKFFYVARSYFNNWTSGNTSEVATNRPYVLAATTVNTGGATCTGTTTKDMTQGYTPAGAGTTFGTLGASISFCAAAFAAGQAVAAGTTTFTGYYLNTSTSSACTITTALTANGSASLGTATVTIAKKTSTVTPLAASITTTAHTFAAGDQLELTVTIPAGCTGTSLTYNGATTPSRITTS